MSNYYDDYVELRNLALSDGVDNFNPNIDIDLDSFVTQVKSQHFNFLKYPKRYPSIFLETTDLPSMDLAVAEIYNQNYFYVGTNVLDGRSYFEFAMLSKSSQLYKIECCKFLYAQLLITNQVYLKSKLPFLYYWNLDSKDYGKEYPSSNYLFGSGIEDLLSWRVTISPKYTHNFLPGFIYTGRVTEKNQSIIYEYKDEFGLYGPLNALYLSSLRPMDLDFPFGQPREEELIFDDCYEFNCPPRRGHLHMYGLFTGYVTTNRYSRTKFYLYERKDGSGFLSEHPPSCEAQNLIDTLVETNNIAKTEISFTSDPGQSYMIQYISTSEPQETIQMGGHEDCDIPSVYL